MDDESEVLRLEREFIAAWNRGDPHGAAALYAEGARPEGAGAWSRRGEHARSISDYVDRPNPTSVDCEAARK